MSDSFGASATRLCSGAAMLLGWRPAEFWDATPAELALVLNTEAVADGPDTATIEALKQRFPDTNKS